MLKEEYFRRVLELISIFESFLKDGMQLDELCEHLAVNKGSQSGVGSDLSVCLGMGHTTVCKTESNKNE